VLSIPSSTGDGAVHNDVDGWIRRAMQLVTVPACHETEAVPSAPGPAGVRVWEVLPRGRGPRGGRAVPEGVHVDDPLNALSKQDLRPVHQLDTDPVRRELDERFGIEVLGLPAALFAEGGPIGLRRHQRAAESSIRGSKSTEEGVCSPRSAAVSDTAVGPAVSTRFAP